MIDFIQFLNNSPLILVTAFLTGLAINFDICPLAGDFAILSYIVNEAKSLKKTTLHVLSYTLGRITAYTSLTLIIFFGLSRINFSFLDGKGEIIIGTVLIVFGLMNLRTKEHCREHELKKRVKDKTLAGSFLWGLLFSLGFCPHSAAIFFGIFMPMNATQSFNPLLAIMFSLGASSVIIFFSILLSLSPLKGKKLLEKLEQKETTTKSLVAVIFILVGLLYLFK